MQKSLIINALFLGMMSAPVLASDIQITVLDNRGEPLKDAVVFLKSDALVATAKPLDGVEMAQQDREFIPGLSIVTRGSGVEFPNRDDVRHHVYSFSPAKTFELKLYIGKPKAPVVFDQEGVIELGCNIHDSMLGWVLVTSTPVYAKTNDDGQVVFEGQEPDQYTLDVWHRSFPYGAPYEHSSVTLGEASVTHTIALASAGDLF